MEDYFYLHIHYGGYFEHVPQIKYVKGKIAVIMVDIDKWSYSEAIDIVKEYGYNSGCKLWYLIPEKCMHDGLRSLSCDVHAMELAGYGLSCDANVVELFIEKDVIMSDKSALVAAKGSAVHSELNLTDGQNLKEHVGNNVAEEGEAQRFDDSKEEREKNGDNSDHYGVQGTVFDVKPRVGRTKKLRRREPDEKVNKTSKLKRRFTSHMCSICNQYGHNARSCLSRPPPDANVTHPNTLSAPNSSQNNNQAITQSNTVTRQNVTKTSAVNQGRGRGRAQVATGRGSRGSCRGTMRGKGRIPTPQI